MAVNGSGDQWNETALLVIGMQKDFVDTTMCKRALPAGEAIVPIVTEAVDVARQRGIFIVVREHDPSGRDVELYRRHRYSSGQGQVVKGSEGAKLAEGLIIKESDYKLVKTRFSAFFATQLDSVLRTSGIKNLVIVGKHLYPPIEMDTAFDAVSLNYDKVSVILDATAAPEPEVHEQNIRDMKKIGVVTPTFEEWRR
uniref:Isochorismatase-like domain-containing protein n=1 Tax=Leersia perrieri TaxID=77586 RepID=A0A0D9VER5_9ORYZ